MKKKFLLLILTIISAVCLAVGISACDSESSGQSGSGSDAEQSQTDSTESSSNSGQSPEDDTSGGDSQEEDTTTVSVTSVTLDKTTLTLEVGKSATLTATVLPENATNKTVNWTTSDGTIATVTDGVVTAVSAGNAVIMVATIDGGEIAYCNVTVTEPEEVTAAITDVTNGAITGKDIYIFADYSTTSLTLSGEVTCTDNCSWKLYASDGITEIPTKVIAALADGESKYYIVVTSTVDTTVAATYTLTVYKSFAVTVTYYIGSEVLKTETAYTGYMYSAAYIPEITDYTFNYWKTAEGQEYSATILSADLNLYADLTAEHTYSEEWSFDNTAHWHACTNDGCDKVKDYEVHTSADEGTVVGNYIYYTCEVCGAEYSVYEHINHTYGDWEVGATPTLTNTGIAVKTCTECDYTLTVILPVLDDTNYTSTVIKRPTATENGISSYTYPHELGDISFEVEIEKSGTLTVSDAVSISTSAESHSQIRSVTGTRGDKRVDSGAITSALLAEIASEASAFSYELYDSYTHIIDNGGSEYWLGYDGEEIYGYVQDDQGNFNILSDSDYIKGYRYYEVYTDTLSYAYGTEDFLAMLYAYAKANYNGDFTEEVVTTASKTTYSFSFGTYILYKNGINGGLFSKITVSFTLSSSFTIETFEYYSVTYANDSDTYDAQTGGWTSDATFNIDENGYAYVTNADGLKFIEIYSVEQTVRKTGETEQTSPYTPETRFYSDFDVTYNGAVIDEDTSITLPVGLNSGYVFAIENLTPDNIVGDTITFYCRIYEDDGTYTDTKIDYGTALSADIIVYLDSETNKFYIKSYLTGDINIVVKSQNVTKEFTINFYAIAPTAFYSTVYNYSSYAGYISETSADNTAETTVYAGQILYFKASLSDEEAGVKTETYTVTVTGTTAAGNEITASDYLLTETSSVTVSTGDIESASEFVAYKAGTYTLTLTSTEDSSVTCTIIVTVNEMPTMESVLSGTYTATFGDSGNAVTVTFGEITKADKSVTIIDDEDETNNTVINYYECTVEGIIKYYNGSVINDNYEQLTIVITYYYYLDTDGTVVMFNPTDMTDVVLPDNMLSSIMKIGEGQEEEEVYPDVEQIFRITFNEAYDLVISHSIGDDDASESVILTR